MDRRVGNSSGTEANTTSNEMTYYTQVVVVLVVVIASIINLSLHQEPETLWIMLLTSCVGYVLPNPRMTGTSVQQDNTDRIESRIVAGGGATVMTSTNVATS
jgi:hypothetical protein